MILSKRLKDPRNNKHINEQTEYATLEEYEIISIKQIKYWCKKRFPTLLNEFLKNEERISDVMYENMIADMEWDESRGMTRNCYRNRRVLWLIKNLAGKYSKGKKVVFYHQSDFETRFQTQRYGFDESIYNQRSYENKLDPRQVFHQKESIDTALVTLSVREKTFLQLYYVEGLTYDEIGKKFEPNISRARVHQVMSRTKKKLEEIRLAG